eukprot:COSAG01_NODE_1924_length_8886_cov_6.780699_3_plen_53_part_00
MEILVIHSQCTMTQFANARCALLSVVMAALQANRVETPLTSVCGAEKRERAA